MDGAGSRCKIVVVGDTQCGKTALLHVFAKDCYPEVSLSKVRVSVESISYRIRTEITIQNNDRHFIVWNWTLGRINAPDPAAD